MPIKYGSNKIGTVKYGSNTIGKIYYGSNLVYTSYSETNLGTVTVNGTGDYALNFNSTAKAYLVKTGGKQYLKITGYYYNMGNNVVGQVQEFTTNINVGSQTAQTTFNVYQYTGNPPYVTTPPTSASGEPYTVTGHVDTSGRVWLPIAHENRYRLYNQFDTDSVLIELKPSS